MLLSEAIRRGSQLRGESHQGPFVRVANSDELLSDVWGAACEAVHSLVAKRNWNKSKLDAFATENAEYRSDIAYLKEIQEKYFTEYFKSPATCPGARPGIYSEGGGRFTGRTVAGLNDVAIEGERTKSLPALTNACARVTNVAEFVEHAFYVHNWTREEVAKAVEWYEQQTPIKVVQGFEHYQDNAVQRRVAQRLTAIARERERQRRSRRAVHFT